jgi:hypothetical protein
MDAKWPAVVVVVVATILTGCEAAPLAPKVAIEAEKRLSTKKLNAGSPNRAAAPVAAPSASPRAAGALAPAPRSSASAVPAAVAAHAALALVGGPQALRVVPFRTPDGEVVDLICQPEDGMARFRLQAPAAGLLVAKAKLDLIGGAQPLSLELTREELEWPATIAGQTTLQVPVRLYETLRVLGENPEARHLTLTTTLYGPDGEALAGTDGQPLMLEAQVDVL